MVGIICDSCTLTGYPCSKLNLKGGELEKSQFIQLDFLYNDQDWKSVGSMTDVTLQGQTVHWTNAQLCIWIVQGDIVK